MVRRGFWVSRIEKAWKEKSVVWLSGVRRAGKTVLCQALPRTEYFDCELPRTRRMLEDPEAFLESLRGRRIILDEIHRLGNPSEVLKIAADHYPSVRVLATGSSTLGASRKFRDTLTGRKAQIMLTPMCLADLADFGKPGMDRRILHGGLPPFFLADRIPEKAFQEWMDDFWAKDIQELFTIDKKASFMKFAEMLLNRSGGMYEATAFAGPCEASRPTINGYLSILEETFVVHVLRPFTSRRAAEIISAPRVYAFDTGFACHYREINELRADDFGPMWEHIVLNEILAVTQSRRINYWRDKRGHEVDFIVPARGRPPLAIECKRTASNFDPVNAMAFSRAYPRSVFTVVAHDVREPFTRKYEGVAVTFSGLAGIGQRLSP